jgi:hypothetical protein
MVKLLRLTTNREDANFDIKFNEDIIIKPKSQLALKNLTLTMNEDKLKIDNRNKEFVFTTNDSNSVFVRGFNLPYQTRTYAEFQRVLDDLSEYSNKQLQCDDNDNDFNTQIEFSVDNNNKIKIEFFKSILFDFVPNISSTTAFVDFNVTPSKIEVSQSNGDTTTQTHKLMFNDTFIKGAGVFRCRIADYLDNSSGNADNGFEIGLSDEPPTNFADNASMTNAQRTYMIRFNRIGSAYTFLKTRAKGDATAEDTSTVNASIGGSATPDTNDILEIRLDEGDIVGNVYIHGGVSYAKNEIFRDTLYGDLTLDAERINGLDAFYDLNPYIIFYGDNTHIKIKDIQHSLEEKKMMNYPQRINQDTTLPQILIPDIDEPVNINISKRYTDSYNLTGEFEFDKSMGDYLGFNNIRNTASSDGYQQDGSFKNMIFNADNLFKPAIYSRNFIVELQNINLTSYDSLYNGRKSILATVVDGNDITINDTDIVVYEPNEITYIDIDNMNPISLRNIKLKVLDKNLNPIKIQGLGVITLLVKEN